MALVKYKVLQAPIDDGVSYIPEKAIPLSIWTLQEPIKEGAGAPFGQVPLVEYKVNLAFLMTYADWAEEFPDEAKEEEGKELARPIVELVKEVRKEEGADNAQ